MQTIVLQLSHPQILNHESQGVLMQENGIEIKYLYKAAKLVF